MSKDALQPARPIEDEGRQPYQPSLPWKQVLAVVVVLVAFIALYQWRQDQKLEALRSEVMAQYDALEGFPDALQSFLAEVERRVMHAQRKSAEEPHVDSDFDLAQLQQGQGLYMRIPEAAAGSPEDIAKAVRSMRADTFTRCLGITPVSVRGLYAQSEAFSPARIEQVQATEDWMRLRTMQVSLQSAQRKHLAPIRQMLRSHYLMLVLDKPSGSEPPSAGVWVWDLRDDELVVRADLEGRGAFIPVRSAIGKATSPRSRRPLPGAAAAAADCSMAAQLSELTQQR